MFSPLVLSDMNSLVRKRGKQIRSLDFQSREVAFQMELLGKLQMISASQAEYFDFVMNRFLNSCIGPKSIVWDIDTSFSISANDADESLFRIIVSGSVLGAAEHRGDLLQNVQRCFNSRGDDFVVRLSEEGRRQPQFENDWELFGLVEFGMTGTAFTEVEPKDVNARQHSKLLSVLLLTIAGGALLIGLGLVVRKMKTLLLRNQEIKEHRAARRERRQKRILRASSIVREEMTSSLTHIRVASSPLKNAIDPASAARQSQQDCIDHTEGSPEQLHFQTSSSPKASSTS
jgi:hypothetical protein